MSLKKIVIEITAPTPYVPSAVVDVTFATDTGAGVGVGVGVGVPFVNEKASSDEFVTHAGLSRSEL